MAWRRHLHRCLPVSLATFSPPPTCCNTFNMSASGQRRKKWPVGQCWDAVPKNWTLKKPRRSKGGGGGGVRNLERPQTDPPGARGTAPAAWALAHCATGRRRAEIFVRAEAWRRLSAKPVSAPLAAALPGAQPRAGGQAALGFSRRAEGPAETWARLWDPLEMVHHRALTAPHPGAHQVLRTPFTRKKTATTGQSL